MPISNEEIEKIGKRIWDNEADQKEELLTFWNRAEGFPSMGIGHFIWPPKNYEGPFKQGSFHKVLKYLSENGETIPEDIDYCPWETREEFYEDIDSPEMQQIRNLLKNTVSLQAQYIKKRLEKGLPAMFLFLPPQQRQKAINNYFRIASCQNGYFVLIDYLNFKHEGTAPNERYNGKGWGLLQVLCNMPEPSSDQEVLKSFTMTAKKLLIERIKNSPPELLEYRWIPGWFNRLN